MMEPTKVFSDRVDYYLQYRPRYPRDIVKFMVSGLQLQPNHLIADIGSGTGFLSELFLQHGYRVYGVEPNREMRYAAENLLRSYPLFKSINATAEATTLDDCFFDFIVVGQAFHWFNAQLAKQEFGRILKPNGFVCLIWNTRLLSGTSFLEAYEQLLLQYALNYSQPRWPTGVEVDKTPLTSFFGVDGFQLKTFVNFQRFNFAGLKGRLLSSSYAPLPEHPHHQPMINQLKVIFTKFQVNNVIQFNYETVFYFGKVTA